MSYDRTDICLFPFLVCVPVQLAILHLNRKRIIMNQCEWAMTMISQNLDIDMQLTISIIALFVSVVPCAPSLRWLLFIPFVHGRISADAATMIVRWSAIRWYRWIHYGRRHHGRHSWWPNHIVHGVLRRRHHLRWHVHQVWRHHCILWKDSNKITYSDSEIGFWTFGFLLLGGGMLIICCGGIICGPGVSSLIPFIEKNKNLLKSNSERVCSKPLRFTWWHPATATDSHIVVAPLLLLSWLIAVAVVIFRIKRFIAHVEWRRRHRKWLYVKFPLRPTIFPPFGCHHLDYIFLSGSWFMEEAVFTLQFDLHITQSNNSIQSVNGNMEKG